MGKFLCKLTLDFHPPAGGLGLQKIDGEVHTLQECLRRVGERAQETSHGQWVLGHGWNQNSWPEGFGTAAHLDSVAPHNLVYLTTKSLHAGWANTAALQAAGPLKHGQDPERWRPIAQGRRGFLSWLPNVSRACLPGW